MQKRTYISALVTAAGTVVLTIVCMNAYEFGVAIVAERVAEQETAEKIVAWERNAERREALYREASREMFLDGIDPQDASIWIAMLPKAELDEHCNALPECTQDTMHVARPITVQARSPWSDGTSFIAVLGIEVLTPHSHRIIPRSTYYVGSQQGVLWRMQTGASQAEVRNLYERDHRLNDWRPVSQSASDYMLGEVRTAFITEWRRRLTETGAQKL